MRCSDVGVGYLTSLFCVGIKMTVLYIGFGYDNGDIIS